MDVSIWTRRVRVGAAATALALIAGLLGIVLAARRAHAASTFTPGDLVVLRIGTGTGSLGSAATAEFLDEYSTAGGASVQSIAVPSSGASSLTNSGSASSEGGLTLSADGHYLAFGGYGANAGTSGIASTASATTPRVVGIADGAGNVDTSTRLPDAYSGNNIRGAVTDGVDVWTGGNGANTDGGVRHAVRGATSSNAVNNAAATTNNVRVPLVAGGQLYASSNNGAFAGVDAVGTGVPTTGGQTMTNVVATASVFGYAFVDRDPTVPGVDTLYAADQAAGILKFAFNGSTWSPEGSVAGNFTGIAVKVVGATAVLYATSGSAANNTLVTLTDSAAFNATIAASAPTTLASAGANKVFRGLAFAPTVVGASIVTGPQSGSVVSGATTTLTVVADGTGPLTYQWYQGGTGDTATPVGTNAASFTTPALSSTTSYWVRVTNQSGSADSSTATVTVITNNPPTISTPAPLAGSIGDPTNATANVTVGDVETPADALLVAPVATDNPGVAPVGNVTVSGTGATRTVSVDPTGVGDANITLAVTDTDGNSTQATLQYAASAASITPSTTRWFTGSSDASTEIDVGGGYMLVGDDENQALRLYDSTRSGPPVASFDYTASLGLTDLTGGVPREVDIEASARVGNVIYWLGSESNNSDGNARPDRDRLFATQVNGSGASTTLTFLGYYDHLREDLLDWDHTGAHGLGADHYGFVAGAATGVAPEDASLGGYNIEGLELAPGSTTTAYVAFRAPISPASHRTNALLVPVTNFASLVSGAPATGPATFGAPIELNLGGLGVRELRKNASDQYLIVAGPAAVTGPQALYTWDGDPADAPGLRTTDLSAAGSPAPYEGVAALPTPLDDSSTLRLVTDSGDTVYYGDATIAKDLTVPEFKKARSDVFTLGALVADQPPVNTVPGAQSTPQDTALAFSSAGADRISVADPDAGTSAVQVSVSADLGKVTLASTQNLLVVGNGTTSVVAVGPLADLNSALDGLTYTPPAGYVGPDTLHVVSNDLAHNGAGGPLTDSDDVAITVTPGPTFTYTSRYSGQEAVSLYVDALRLHEGPAAAQHDATMFMVFLDGVIEANHGTVPNLGSSPGAGPFSISSVYTSSENAGVLHAASAFGSDPVSLQRQGVALLAYLFLINGG